MKIKKFSIVCIAVLIISFTLFSASKKEEMWTKAITEKDINLRFQYLKDYQAEFGDQKDKFAKFLYINLADTSFQITKYDEAIQAAEIAISYPDIDDSNKIRLYLLLANSYNITKKDMDKAFKYAGMVIDLANTLISQQQTTDQEPEKKEKFSAQYNTFYVAPAYRIQAQILYTKGKDDPAILKEMTDKAIKAFEADKSQRSIDLIVSLASSLYKKQMTDEAIKALELILDKEKPDYKQAYMLATLYNKKKNKDKAIAYFEIAYRAQRQAKLALNIGKLIYKQDLDKGIKYFSEAFVLGNSNKQSDAYKFLENLYFNNPEIKKLTPEEQEKGFRVLVNAARERLGRPPLGDNEPVGTDQEKEKETETEEAEG
ncbi:MAG: hypothetical protein MUF15_19670 [Acidobacteria bacterium]|nr:hypothetical protein [Acidobacteriota bacterium]